MRGLYPHSGRGLSREMGGMDRFARQANEIAAKGYEGFSFS